MEKLGRLIFIKKSEFGVKNWWFEDIADFDKILNKFKTQSRREVHLW